MYKKIISLFLILVIMFSSFIEPVLATEPEIFTQELTESMEMATDSNAIESEKSEEIIEDNLLNNESIDNSILKEEPVDETLESIDISTDSNAIKDEEENIEPEIETEFEENNISINENILAMIPESSEDLLDDFGMSEGFIADISKISTFSLRNPNNVTLKTPQYEDGTELSVVHFIESIYHISDDSIVLNVSDYSNSSKELLAPAISAYQEYFDSNEDFVAIEIFDTVVEDGLIEFETNSFSIFAVGQTFLNTFEFYVDDELVNTQYIIGNSNGEGLLVEPEIPTKEDALFKGWKINGTDKYQKFGTIKVNMSEHTTIRLDADFEETYHVYFYYEAKEGSDILETLSGKPGDVIYTEKVDYPLNLDKHVVSWHTDVECTSPDVLSVTIENEDIILYPKVERGYWITFYTEGGSYIDPMFFGKGEYMIAPPDPQKVGYTFIGWYDSNGVKFEFEEQEITSSMILTARYEANLVNYTVQIVMQNPDSHDLYDPVLGGIFTKQGLSGETLSGSDIPIEEIEECINGLAADSYFKSYLRYFYYNTDLTTEEKIEIEGDGSSVIHIYYDRYVTEMRFFLSYSDTEPYTIRSGLFDERMAESAWPIPSEEEFPGFAGWEVSKGGSRPTWNGAYRFGFTFSEKEDLFIYNLYAVGGGGLTHSIKYYAQTINPDGTVPDVGVTLGTMPSEPHVDYYNPLYPGNENNQILIDNWSNVDFETATNAEITNNGAWKLDGADSYTANGTYTGIVYRHGLASIPGFTAIAIGFDLYNNVGDGTEYRMDSFKDHPNLPNSYIDYWATSKKVAQGMGTEIISSKTYYHLDSDKWYAISEPFRAYKFFGDVYVRLLRHSYNLQFIVDGAKVGDFDVYYETDLGLEKFTSISDRLTPPDGYIFDGWFTSPSLTEDTRFYLERNTMPYNDMILYAKWTPIRVELDVHVTIDGTDEIIEGFNSFTVKYGSVVQKERVDELKPNVELPEGAIWYGWYEKINVGGEKELLVPFNFDKQLVEDLVLYPFYSYMDPTKVFYDLNGGTGTTPIDIYNYAVGKGAIILDCPDIVAPEGKVFLGWNTKSDGTGLTFRPNDIMRIPENNPILYALYGDVPDGPYDVSIKYINTVSGEEVFESYQLYDEIFVKNMNIFSIPINKYYIFKEFNTKSDGTGNSFNPGDQIYLTNEGENILYAIFDTSNILFLDIPILKEFIKFQPTDEIFEITGTLCDEYGNSTSGTTEKVNIKYQGNQIENALLKMVFDRSEIIEDTTYYLKVYEKPKDSLIVYDTNYYIVEFKLVDFTPTIMGVKKYMQNGTEIESFEFVDCLEFTNIMTIEADTLPDMGGNGISNFRNIGLFIAFIGIFILIFFEKLSKRK